MHLVVVQERSSLLVLGDNNHSSDPAGSEDLGKGNNEGGNEEDGHDGECEDPLEGDDLSEELAHAERGAEDTEGKSDRVVL